MTALPSSAKAVVIGAGIVGSSVAHHLARLGWSDLVLLEKGPLPNPGGSTGHASNFIFPVDHSKEMTALTLESVRQYKDLGVFTESGGIEVARTEERMQELTRRVSSAIAWGIEPVSLVTPAEVKELVPFIDESVILGGFYTPSVGVVDSLRAGTLMREQSAADGALTVAAGVEVLGIDVERGRVRRVRTTDGDIDVETVVIACGVWSPKLGRMAGASIPLTPAVHQMIDIGPVPRFEQASRSIEFPIVRDMDTNMYERQDGTSLEIGSYAHRPILYEPEDLPSVEEAPLSPTEFPFTQEDFAPQLEHALELMPEIVGDESVGIKYAINGILSLTPDGMPILGETPEVNGLWSAAAVWVKEGPGVGKGLAEWMVHGESEIDLHSSDVARFHEHHRTSTHIKARTSEGFNKTYGIVHPSEQWASNRNVRLSPFNRASASSAPSSSRRRAGSARSGTSRTRRCSRSSATGSAAARRSGTLAGGRRSSTRSTSPCASGPRSSTCPRSRSSTSPGRERSTLSSSSRSGRSTSPSAGSSTRRGSRPAAASSPTSRSCGSATRSSGSSRAARTACPTASGSATTSPATAPPSSPTRPRRGAPSGSGGRAPATSSRASPATTSPTRASPSPPVGRSTSGRCASSRRASPTWATSAGSSTSPSRRAPGCGTSSGRRVERTGAVPAGIGVYGTTGRLEKCYRAYGTELESEYTVVEAGMAPPKVKDADFVGKEAHLRHRDEEPVAILCTLTVDDHTSSAGVARYPLGREPVLSRAGEPLVDRKGRRSYVTSAGAGPSVGKYLLMSYLPPEQAVEGTELLVDYLGDRYPVSVAVAGATPVFDPENARIRS